MPCIHRLKLGAITVGFNEFEHILVPISFDAQWHDDTPHANFLLPL
jgi:hypothetical protein